MKRTNCRSLILIVIGAGDRAGDWLSQRTTLAQNWSATSITGHVKDPQGANLPGATVTFIRVTALPA